MIVKDFTQANTYLDSSILMPTGNHLTKTKERRAR